MAQELGRIQRPSAEQYQGRRKLLLVPLVYSPRTDDEAGSAVLQRYWDQMQTQVASLESALGGLGHVYHESLTEGGSTGLELLKTVDQRSHVFVGAKIHAGAVLEATEDQELLVEAVDLQRLLMMPLASQKVALRVREWFDESNRGRYQHIAEQVDATLGENQVGLLLISEGHQVQFPADIEVFYVSPPALDEYRRWVQNWVARQQQQSQEAGEATQDEVVAEDTQDEADAPSEGDAATGGGAQIL